MKMTKRDIAIMEFIHEFWFCEITQIEQKFRLKKPRSYQIMQRLVREKLVIHERVFLLAGNRIENAEGGGGAIVHQDSSAELEIMILYNIQLVTITYDIYLYTLSH